MNHVLSCTNGLLQANYRAQGEAHLNQRESHIQQLFTHRQLPAVGWNDLYIRTLLNELALMDSNNFVDTVGVGEREGRVYSNLVRERQMNLSHGMGRSGDLLAQQPKAVGSSLLLTLTHALTLHAIKLAGLTEAKRVLLLPVATGMSIVLTLTAIKQAHPKYLQAQKDALSRLSSNVSPLPPSSTPSNHGPEYVIWSRIDQKTCLKSIFAAGLIPIVIELKQIGDQLVTDLDAIQAAIERVGSENVIAIVSTTSCFAPRVPDRVIEISKLCAQHSIAHVINNAYGIQSASTCALINSAVRKHGRVDAVISSMDKNFMVPVGGAMVIGFQGGKGNKDDKAKSPTRIQPIQIQPSSSPASSSTSAAPSSTATLPNVLNLITSLYPGRASSSSITDLFITLLSMGVDGWQRLLTTRESLVPVFKARLSELASQHGERLLETSENDISFGMTLNRIEPNYLAANANEQKSSSTSSSPAPSPGLDGNVSDTDSTVSISSASIPTAPSVPSKFVPSYLGSLLFSRNVSGPRVLSSHTPPAKINGITFQHYGTHSNSYPDAYVTAACGIGMEAREVDAFIQRLDKCIKEFNKQKMKQQPPPTATSTTETR